MTDEADLAGLLAAVATGDRTALKAVYARQSTRLFGIAMAILRDRTAAADVLQDAFLKLWQRAGQFDPARGPAGAWLGQIVRNAALDLADYGIRINTVCPGIIRTRLGLPLIDDPVAGPEYLKRVPLRRFGEPAEIANAVLFLASDEASYVTGEDLVVDGGATLGVVLEIPDGSIPGGFDE